MARALIVAVLVLAPAAASAGYETSHACYTYLSADDGVLKACANLNDGNTFFRVRKVDGGAFNSPGTMRARVGAWQTYGTEQGAKSYLAGASSVDVYVDITYFQYQTKQFYLTTANSEYWVGPIEVTHIPPTPQAPVATAVAADGVSLTWDDFGAGTYSLFRATSASGPYQQIFCQKADSYTDQGSHLQSNTTYYYKVRAGNDQAQCSPEGSTTGWSGYSSYVAAKTWLDSLEVPDLKEPLNGAGQVQEPVFLDWYNVPDAEAYRVLVHHTKSTLTGLASDAGCNFCIIDETGLSSSSYTVPDYKLLAGKTYFWMVRAGAGIIGSDHSEVWEFTTALETPTAVSPYNGQPNVQKPVTLEASKPSGATGYRAFLASNPSTLNSLADTADSCGGCLKVWSNQSSNKFTVPDGLLDSEQTYYWMARAGSTDAGSGNSPVWSFTMKKEWLDTPIITAPSDGQTGVAMPVTLAWNPVDQASNYRLFVASSASTLNALSNSDTECSGCIHSWAGGTTQHQVPVDKLAGAATYYWIVRAGGVGIGSENSAPTAFTTAQSSLPMPQHTAPSDNEIDVPEPVSLQWESVPGAAQYRVFVATSKSVLDTLDDETATCGACLFPPATTGATSYTIDATLTEANTQYFWMVRAGATGAGSVNSTPWSFKTVGDHLDPPALVNPVDKSPYESTEPMLTWQTVPNATNYRVFIAPTKSILDALDTGTQACDGCVYNEAVGNTDHAEVLPGTLDYDTTYHWMVRAGSEAIAGAHSEVWSFTTAPEPFFGAVGPSNGTFAYGEVIPVTWTNTLQPANATMTISLRRQACDAGIACSVGDTNWVVLADATPNDGSEELTAPTGLTLADDWVVNVRDDATGEENTALGTVTIVPDDANAPPDIADCVGVPYEQVLPIDGVLLPTIKAVYGHSTVEEGGTVAIEAVAWVDTSKGGTASYYWCTSHGTLAESPAGQRHVVLTAPAAPGQDVTATVTLMVGDGLGHVALESFDIIVTEAGNTADEDPAPTVAVGTPTGALVGSPVDIGFSLSDSDGVADSTAGLVTDVYVLHADGSQESVATGLLGNVGSVSWTPAVSGAGFQVRVVTTDGNKVAEGLSAPFDVDNTYSVDGFVVDGAGLPLSNVYVEVLPGGPWALTDASGYYSILLPNTGSFAVTPVFGNSEFLPATADIEVSDQSSVAQANFAEWLDTDGDGIADAEDKCPSKADADQLDTDGDGLGDACDPDANGDGQPDYPGDVAPFGNPDGCIDVSDAVVALQIAVGALEPSAMQFATVDVAPLGAADEVVDVSDASVLLQAATGQLSVGTPVCGQPL